MIKPQAGILTLLVTGCVNLGEFQHRAEPAFSPVNRAVQSLLSQDMRMNREGRACVTVVFSVPPAQDRAPEHSHPHTHQVSPSLSPHSVAPHFCLSSLGDSSKSPCPYRVFSTLQCDLLKMQIRSDHVPAPKISNDFPSHLKKLQPLTPLPALWPLPLRFGGSADTLGLLRFQLPHMLPLEPLCQRGSLPSSWD